MSYYRIERKKKRIEKQQLTNNWIICYIYFFYSDTDSIELIQVFIICHLRVLIKIISIWLKFSSKKSFHSYCHCCCCYCCCCFFMTNPFRSKNKEWKEEKRKLEVFVSTDSHSLLTMYFLWKKQNLNSCSCLFLCIVFFFFTNLIQ